MPQLRNSDLIASRAGVATRRFTAQDHYCGRCGILIRHHARTTRRFQQFCQDCRAVDKLTCRQ